MTPKDEFEEFVRNNRDEFDKEEPSLGLWDKIEQQLEDAPKQRVITVDWMLQAKRIAAVLFIGTVSILGYEYLQKKPIKEDVVAASQEVVDTLNPTQLPVEVKEEMHYYSMRVNASLTEFDQLTKNTPELNRDVKKDLKELDEDMDMLLKDLKENMDSEEVLEAMIQNYRYRLQVLEDIMNEIKEAKYDDDEQSVEI